MSLNNSSKTSEILSAHFFQRADVVSIAKELIGKVLCTEFDGVLTTGQIVETEAYNGIHDKACHAHSGRFTKRTKVMYEPGGTAYIYLCYGIHHLFNIITNNEGIPDAVLIRAIEPLEGTQTMLERRKMNQKKRNLTAGPGILSQALGIKTDQNGIQLTRENGIWIEDHGLNITSNNIISGPRVGIGYAGEDALLPYRFSLRGNPWVSPAKT